MEFEEEKSSKRKFEDNLEINNNDHSNSSKREKSSLISPPFIYPSNENHYNVGPTPNQGNIILDPDSFLNIFWQIPFSAGEITSLRRTCVWWKRVLSFNALWEKLFLRDFAPSPSAWVSY